MSSWRQQAVIDAPVEVVWELVGDPNTYPEWASNVVEVTGLPTISKGAEFEQATRSPLGTSRTTFVIDELEDLRRIRLHCTQSGYFSEWSLTEAQGETFADIELGMNPSRLPYRVLSAVAGKRTFRQLLDEQLDGLRQSVHRRRSAGQR